MWHLYLRIYLNGTVTFLTSGPLPGSRITRCSFNHRIFRVNKTRLNVPLLFIGPANLNRKHLFANACHGIQVICQNCGKYSLSGEKLFVFAKKNPGAETPGLSLSTDAEVITDDSEFGWPRISQGCTTLYSYYPDRYHRLRQPAQAKSSAGYTTR